MPLRFYALFAYRPSYGCVQVIIKYKADSYNDQPHRQK